MRFRARNVTGFAIAAAIGIMGTLPQSAAAQEGRVNLTDRIRGAQRVVVGTVIDVEPVFGESEFGDQLIISRTTVAVEESLKGPATASTMVIEVEGGTIGDLTLSVSDVEPAEVGERVAFMLRQLPSGVFVPYLRGQGLLKLDASGQVRGEPWSIADVRAAARALNPGR